VGLADRINKKASPIGGAFLLGESGSFIGKSRILANVRLNYWLFLFLLRKMDILRSEKWGYFVAKSAIIGRVF